MENFTNYNSKIGMPVYNNGSLNGSLYKSGLGFEHRDNDGSYLKTYKFGEPIKPLLSDPYEYKLNGYSSFNSRSSEIFRNSYERSFGTPIYDSFGSYSGRIYQAGLGYNFRDTLGSNLGSFSTGSSINWIK